MAALRVARSGFTGTVSTATALRVARSGFTGTVGVLLDPIANATIEPATTQTVIIGAILTGGGAADSYAFRVVSGIPVGLSPSGAVCTFPTPAVAPPNNGTVVIGVTATKSGVTSPERQVTYTILPTLRFVWNGSTFVSARHTRVT